MSRGSKVYVESVIWQESECMMRFMCHFSWKLVTEQSVVINKSCHGTSVCLVIYTYTIKLCVYYVWYSSQGYIGFLYYQG